MLWRQSLHPIDQEPVIASHPKQKIKEPQTAVLPLLGDSSVCHVDGCGGMTGCLCLYVGIRHQCKHWWFQQRQQTERLQATYGLC